MKFAASPIERAVPTEESLTVEFKSDRDPLPDQELAAAAVCLANAKGGDLYVGVENDGTITGLHARHRNVTSVAAMIANRTIPPLSIRAELIEIDNLSVA